MIWYHPIHLYITYHMISNDDMISSYIFICSILISSQWVTDQRSVRGFNLHKCKKRPIHLTVKCIAVKIRIITLINYFTLSQAATNKGGFLSLRCSCCCQSRLTVIWLRRVLTSLRGGFMSSLVIHCILGSISKILSPPGFSNHWWHKLECTQMHIP